MIKKSRPTNDQQHPPDRFLSTFVFTFILLALVLLLNIQRHVIVAPEIHSSGKYGPHFDIYEFGVRGWPFRYAREEFLFSSCIPPTARNVLPLPVPTDIHLPALITNGLIGICLVTFAAFLFHQWRCRRKRLLQFHLSDLLILVTVVATLFAALAHYRNQHRREQAILAAIDNQAHLVLSSYTPIAQRTAWRPLAPLWLCEFPGTGSPSIFYRVVAVEYTHDHELEHLAKLRHIRMLRITNATNQQLTRLQQLPHLEALDMVGAYESGPPVIDDDGCEVDSYLRLPYLPKLRGLNLYESVFRGEGLENLPSLEVLDASRTDIDDHGLQNLANSHHLKSLTLDDTKVTSEGLRHLKQLRNLEELWLYGTRIDDHGVAHLAKLHKLHTLQISGTAITDASIPVLRQLTQLEFLGLHGTSITKHGIKELTQTLPNCEIYD